MARTLRSLAPPLLALAFVAAGLVGQTSGPLGGDEHYIFANLGSPDWSDRLRAYNADFPGPSGGHWYSGVPAHQRRYVRILPSAVLSLEFSLWGSQPAAFKRVSLAIHLLNCLLGYRLLLNWLGSRRCAAIVVAVVGLHPVVAEPIDWVACQNLLVAATMSLLAANALAALFRGAGRATEVALCLFAFLAMTSYEAAVAVPLLLVAADAWIRRPPTLGRLPLARWGALLALYPLYALLVWWNRLGVVRSDASYRATADELLRLVVSDFSNYLVKSGIGQPRFYDASAYEVIGHPASLLALLVLIGALLWFFARRRATLLGIFVYLGFLVPPLLVRAAVSWTNLPSTRQLYLPLIGIAIVLGALFERPARPGHVAAAVLLCAAMAASHWFQAPESRLALAHAEMGRVVREELRDFDPDAPVVVIGHSRCGYDVRFDAGRHRVWNLVPLSARGDPAGFGPVGDRTLVVRDPGGLAVPVAVPPRRPGQRFDFEVPELVRTGAQRIGIATVTTPPRAGGPVTELRFEFDRPLAEHAFFGITGCNVPQRVSLP